MKAKPLNETNTFKTEKNKQSESPTEVPCASKKGAYPDEANAIICVHHQSTVSSTIANRELWQGAMQIAHTLFPKVVIEVF